MKIKQNIDKMHELFGETEHVCGNCKYLFEEYMHYRCRKWGEHSEWNTDFQACKLWEERNGLE